MISAGQKRHITRRIKAALPLLSLLIVIVVFWWLKLTGITMSDEAFCGYTEHIHTDTCYDTLLICETEHEHTEGCYNTVSVCTQEEHVHHSSCYSDINADLEGPEQWEASIPGIPSEAPLAEKLVAIAASQKGYSESVLNFTVDSSGVRHGYTRYGEWYGNPYGDWSTMFVSFCLNYAGGDKLPIQSAGGADMLMLEFERIGRFAAASQYSPKPGDIVFFENNTSAIIKSVSGNTASVIQGDYEDAVTERTILITAEDTVGYGILPTDTANNGLSPPIIDESGTDGTETEEIPNSNEESSDSDDTNESEETETPPEQNYNSDTEEILITEDFTYDSQNTARVVDVPLDDYLDEKEGEFFFTLTDTQNRELPKDENENYIASPDTTYKLTMSAKSPQGFAPGTYVYDLPPGLTVSTSNGVFILDDGTNVGTWTVDENGLITFNFNQSINNRTDVVISATMGTVFSETVDYIDFDGKILVVIEKPPEETKEIEVSKWGHQGRAEDGEDPTKIYWTIQLFCPPGVSPAGSILRDHPGGSGHVYLPSDMENGISFGMSVCDPVTWNELQWHTWTLYQDDPTLSWTELGWVYHIPDIGPCIYCHNVDLTTNENAVYFWIQYTSTPIEEGITGNASYTNTANIAGHHTTGWSGFQYSATTAGIIKTGDFYADENGGAFTWRIEATIPAMVQGEKAEYFWYLWDETKIRDEDGNVVGYIDNDSNLANVQMETGGTLTNVPIAENATENDVVAWGNTWTDYEGEYAYGRQLDLFCRCTCTEETCPEWYSSGCGTKHWGNTDFCRCWTLEQDVKLIFTYETTNAALIEHYGGIGYYVSNEVQLNNKRKDSNGDWVYSNQDDDGDTILIPGYFSKELTKDFDGYVANYTITVNEAMLPLTDEDPVLIHDMMTETLAYISGSLVITWHDADGNTGTLEEGTDYTVTYDGTGNQKDESGNTIHVLDVLLLHPKAVTYTLNYDTTLIIPDNVTSGIKYKNSATVELWGQNITVESEEKIHADINIAARTYSLSIFKTDSFDGHVLSGALFGMFNEHGGLITSGKTDENGKLPFETDIINGIVLREHVLYYVQELEAPEGYRLDDTKHWFCFCNTAAESCSTCDLITQGIDAFRIPYEQVGTVAAKNTLNSYELPATGGMGNYKYYILSGALISVALCIAYTVPIVTRYVHKRKRERRLE